jgi:D-alanyl-D-alanine carboxypeptidase
MRIEPASITKVMTAYVAFRALAERRGARRVPVLSCRWATRCPQRCCCRE